MKDYNAADIAVNDRVKILYDNASPSFGKVVRVTSRTVAVRFASAVESDATFNRATGEGWGVGNAGALLSGVLVDPSSLAD